MRENPKRTCIQRNLFESDQQVELCVSIESNAKCSFFFLCEMVREIWAHRLVTRVFSMFMYECVNGNVQRSTCWIRGKRDQFLICIYFIYETLPRSCPLFGVWQRILIYMARLCKQYETEKYMCKCLACQFWSSYVDMFVIVSRFMANDA